MPDQRTRVRTIDPVTPEAETLREAAAVLRAGGLVAFPTETVYGLAANALDPAAVGAIFAAKGRPATNPLIVHIDSKLMLPGVAATWPPAAATLAARYWPGPLTLVLPKATSVPAVVTGGGPTVAVRMPAHPVALGLIRAAGVPLAAPSANRSTELSPTRAEHVRAGLDGRIDLILDGGPTANGIESTVLDMTADGPVLLRPGPIPVSELERVVGPIARRREGSSSGGALPSPGMMPRHYAPRTPVELLPDIDAIKGRANETTAALVIGEPVGVGGVHVRMPATASSYAARLYDVLHDLDRRGASRILIELPPDTDEWLAVRDRLTRAASAP